jgi:uncharacterized protein (DUF342 family)
LDGFRALEPERKPKRCWVRAPDAAAALVGASDLLAREPEELEILSSRGGQFHIGVRFVDLALSFGISEDEMQTVLLSVEADSAARAPIVGTVTRQLALAGIVFGVDPVAIEKVLKGLQSGELDSEIVVAQGQVPRPRQAGAVEPMESIHGSVVFPGEAFARLVVEKEAVEGKTVLGTVLNAPHDGPPFSLDMDEGCVLNSVKNQISSLVYGFPWIDGSRVGVREGLLVSDDDMRVDMEIGARRLSNKAISVVEIKEVLSGYGIVSDLVDMDTLRAAVKSAWEEDDGPNRICVARGREPVTGRAEWMEILEPGEQMLFTGQVIVRVHPSVPSSPGLDVLGKEITPRSTGKEDSFQFDTGLFRAEDSTEVVASFAGRLVTKGQRLTLNPAIKISPDGLSCLVDVPPVDEAGVPFNSARLMEWLEQAGVLSEYVDAMAVEQSLKLSLLKNQVISDCMLAVGRPPTEAWDAEYKPVSATTRTGAYPGDSLVVIESREPAQPGVTVTGQVIKAPTDTVDERVFLAGVGCEEQGGAIVATTYGRVVFDKKSVSVVSALRISEGGTEAHLAVYVKRIGGASPDEEKLLAYLETQGLSPQCLDLALLKKALGSSKSREILIACSIPPVQAIDARICSPGDAREFPVFPGDRVAWVQPSVPSKSGLTVLGEVIPAAVEPIEVSFIAGDYCQVSAEPKEVTANAYGILRIVEQSSTSDDLSFLLEIQSSIWVDEEKHLCRMDVFPEKINGDLVCIEDLCHVLCESGVVGQSIDRNAIGNALALSAGLVQKNVLVARGQKPSSGEDWVVQPLAKDDLGVVFPGEAIARVHAEKAGAHGWDLEGSPIEMEEAERGLSLHPRGHCVLSEDGMRALSAVYGRGEIEGICIRVVPGFRVGPAEFTLRMDVFPRRSDGTQIAEKDLLNQLKVLEIPDDLLLREVISDALERAWAGQQTQWHVLVAQGFRPKKGTNGTIVPVGDHTLGCVFPGDLVAQLTPEVPPVPGKTVFGNVIPAEGVVRPAKVSPEEGCELMNATEVVATQYGRPFLDGKKVMVVSSLYLANDGMRVAMDLFSKRSNAEAVEVDSILELLQKKGITEEFIDPEALALGIEEAENRGGTFWDFEVAVGRPPVLGKDGWAEKTGPANGCVFPGESFALFHPHTPGVPGLTVDGRSIPPSTEPQLIRLLHGSGTKIAPDGLLAFSELYGEPALIEGVASVIPGFRVAEDDMAAFMDIWPFRASGEPVNFSDLRSFLLGAGIEVGCVDETALKEAVQAVAKTQEVLRDFCVAKGLEPVEGSDGQAVFSDQLAVSCVFPGEVFGHLVLPVLATPGVTVRGKIINPAKGVREVKFTTKEGVVFDPAELTLVAEFYGHIQVTAGRVTERKGTGLSSTELLDVELVEGMTISESLLVCRMNIFPQRLKGGAVERADLLAVLQAAGVKKEHILDRVLVGARKAAARQLKPQMSITIAKGVFPRHGQDGQLELTHANEGQAGERGAFGRIDFREKKSFLEVSEGSPLATLSLPSEGQAGETVTGEPLDARDGKDGSFELGPGVEIQDGQVIALRDGVMSVRGNFIDVVELVVIEGDVDYRTGNVKIQTGSVRITGSILPGFEVFCPEDVEVGEVVEGAKIVAGGNVVVRGAVVSGGDSDCSIDAGGEISVGLARNVTLRAKGDVLVQKELFHCEVICEGHLIADRKPGVVSGGNIVARKGATMYQLGSSQWTPTILRVGGTGPQVAEIQKELGGLRRQRLRLNDRLGGQSDEELLSACSSSERPHIEALCLQRDEIRTEVGKLEAALADCLTRFKAEPDAIVVIKDSLFPRVVLNFPLGQWAAEVQVSRARFFFDTQEHQVEHLDIGTPLPDFLGYAEGD